MIVHVDPSAPALFRLLATTALAAHIGGASTGLASGSIAMIAKKGGRTHQVAGTTFFLSMLSMSAAAAVTAPLLPDPVSALMGVFVFYLTATAWATVQRAPGRVGRFEIAAAVAATGVALGDLAIAVIGGTMPKGLIYGEPSQVGYVFAAVAALAVVCDLRVLRQGGLIGRRRTARHLWRMCTALAIAWGSFAAQPKAQPPALHGSPWLALPPLAVLLAMIVWLIRMRPRGRAKTAALAA